MENISITTLEDFKQILGNIKSSEKVRIYINDGFHIDVLEIVKIYNDLFSQNTFDENFVNLCINIHIDSPEDYDNFLDRYCEGNKVELSPILSKVEVAFIINLNEKSGISLLSQYQNSIFPKFACSCKSMSARIIKIVNMSDVQPLHQSMPEFQLLIRNNVNIFNHEKYKDKYILLSIDVSENGFDLNKLHNNLLICCKYQNCCRGFVLNIIGDLSRIKPYVQNAITANVFIICNNMLIEPDLNSVGKLPPAIFFRPEDLSFFKSPLSHKHWTLVSGKEKISAKIFCDEHEKRYWTYLRMCQKFLFEEFDDNASMEYTRLRKEAFSSKFFFEEYVDKMPFLAICIFSIYDNFYRSNLLKQAKKIYGKKTLKIEDLLLSEQRNQSWDDYKKYQSNKDKYDIKNLFAYDIKGGIHKTVVSEIFECLSIAEGLLQILENAVLHAGGGLLSMRIYSREVGLEKEHHKKEHHVKYLDSMYTEDYFKYKKANFYLEILISDLSEKSIPMKFVENLLADENKGNYENLLSLSSSLAKPYDFSPEEIIKIFSDETHSMEYFFSEITDDRLKTFRQLYYSIDENLVHHYGLEIFNNILTVRNGMFSVCGYNLCQDNLELIFNNIFEQEVEKIQYLSNDIKKEVLERIFSIKEEKKRIVRENLSINKQISGTTYSILFPLVHSALTENALSIENVFDCSEISDETYVVKPINSADLLGDIDSNVSSYNIVNKISENIYQSFDYGDVACIFLSDITQEDASLRLSCFEELIKGIVLFALRKINIDNVAIMPIAIVNLTSFQLIEACRIISIYYAKEVIKHTTTINPFEKMPIYLKCAESGKEIIFNGKDIESVRRNVVKTAMVDGTMFDELSTIVEILKKEAK